MISFVLPVYNSSLIIKENVEILKKFLYEHKIKNYEIVIINDGSIDDTAAIAKSLDDVKLVEYEKNVGKSYALKYSSNFVKGEYVIFMDVDLPSQMDLTAIKNIIAELKNFDIVIGSRYLPDSHVKRKKFRLFLSKMYRITLVVLFPNLKISDTDFGMKGFRKKEFVILNGLIQDDRWSWDLEMIIIAKKKNMQIKEIPVVWEEEGGSTFGNINGPLDQLASTIKLRMIY
ncbi:glycosyltransferase [Candidatus Woesearchaeota archaeon]|nr:glycosyltransferase [Candidatus Woesearchaeota archaeon]